MKKLKYVVSIMVILIFSAAPAFATQLIGLPSPNLMPDNLQTLIDFDDYATGTAVGQYDYVAEGVASITETTGKYLGYYAGSQSLPNYIGTGPENGWDGTIRFEFEFPAKVVWIGIADGQGEETITSYDKFGNVLESYAAPAGVNVYTGIASDNWDIQYFEISGDFFAVDDLQFNAVPEPATMLLLGSGLFGLAGLGRRKFLKKG
jgi:hypothetical protein